MLQSHILSERKKITADPEQLLQDVCTSLSEPQLLFRIPMNSTFIVSQQHNIPGSVIKFKQYWDSPCSDNLIMRGTLKRDYSIA